MIIWQKEDLSPVTNLDVAIQEAIIDVILTYYSDDGIICEEGNMTNRTGISNYNWIIDPIDGTNNFIQGKIEYGISVGLMQGDRFVEAYLIFPAINERYYAAIGLGIWINGVVFRSQASYTGVGHKNVILCSKTFEKYRSIFESLGYMVNCYNCATYSLLMLLKREAFMYHTINTMIYDVGPMAFILKEAGVDVFNSTGSCIVFSHEMKTIPFFLALSDADLKETFICLLEK